MEHEPDSLIENVAPEACEPTGAPPADDPLAENPPIGRWSRIVTIAGLIVLGVAPWASAQLEPLDPPPAVLCPPLTAIATPTLFDVLFGTRPFRWPFQ